MFRYLGFSWDVASAAQAFVAQQLDESIGRTEGWHVAHASPGLRVYIAGGRAGVNESYPLPRAKGVVLGRLFRRGAGDDAARNVDLSTGEGNRILQTQGRALIDDYWGRYVAILRTSESVTCVLRDPSGFLPCFQTNIKGVGLFFSWLEDLIEFTPNLPLPRVNWAGVAAFVALRQLGGCETALEGVTRVLPGYLTPLGNAGAPSSSLWSASAIAAGVVEPERQIAAARLRQEVIESGRAWSSAYDAVLLRLSGGVDSAILLGSLRAASSETRITCLNYHSAGSDSDERAYARLAAAKAGVELVERERDNRFRLDEVLSASRTPTPVSYLGRLGTGRGDVEVADTHGARAMFTGGGGDQLFFQVRCTWPAADYLSHHGFGRGFLRASLDAARLGKVSLWQSMRQAVVDQRHRSDPLDELATSLTLVRREAFSEVRAARYLHPELLGESALPIGKFQQLQMLLTPTSYYDPYLGEVAPELVNPLLSQPIVELCLRLPTWLLTQGGQGRALARRAFARELPREIATRHSKGGMEEHVSAALHRNQASARELLLDGHLVRHGLLDRQKTEKALAGRTSDFGSHAAEIHNWIATEAWLRRFVDAPIR